jgi:histidinol-phosphate/aromatic aminotransferase/cobyric acid decarboxylase-like protein
MKNKITIRPLTSYGLKSYIRMTIGTASEMKNVVKVFNNF